METLKEFNDLLKDLNISRREFAEQIGLTYNSIGAMLTKGKKGKEKPTPKWVTSVLIIVRKIKEIKEINKTN